jgi:hypothetical protein
MSALIVTNCDNSDPTAASSAERSAWIKTVLNHPGNTLTAEQLLSLPDEALRGCAALAQSHGSPVANSGSGGMLPPPNLMSELLAGQRR